MVHTTPDFDKIGLSYRYFGRLRKKWGTKKQIDDLQVSINIDLGTIFVRFLMSHRGKGIGSESLEGKLETGTIIGFLKP